MTCPICGATDGHRSVPGPDVRRTWCPADVRYRTVDTHRSIWCRVGIHRWRYYDQVWRPEGSAIHGRRRRRCTRVGCVKDEVVR